MLSDKHIMVIDDDEDDRKMFCRSLREAGGEIGCLRASNGKDALEYLLRCENSLPEIIFLDINMPVMTGWEFLAKIKKESRLKSVPVIMFSTSSNQRDVQIAYDLGVAGYCVKPDNPVGIREVLAYISSNINKQINLSLLEKSNNKYFRFPVAA